MLTSTQVLVRLAGVHPAIIVSCLNSLISVGNSLLTDYYRKYPILRQLNSTTSAAVINHLKSVFAENRIPETLLVTHSVSQSSQCIQSARCV